MVLLPIFSGNKMIEDHGQRALHVVLKGAKYSFVETLPFHPPLNTLQISLPLGKLTLKHLRTLISILDIEWIRNLDDSGKLPIHGVSGRRRPCRFPPFPIHITKSFPTQQSIQPRPGGRTNGKLILGVGLLVVGDCGWYCSAAPAPLHRNPRDSPRE